MPLTRDEWRRLAGKRKADDDGDHTSKHAKTIEPETKEPKTSNKGSRLRGAREKRRENAEKTYMAEEDYDAGSLSNMRKDEDMDIEEEEVKPDSTEKSSSGGTTTAFGSHETPVLIKQPEVKYFANTRTMEIKDRFWVTGGDDRTTSTFDDYKILELRMNSPYSPLNGTVRTFASTNPWQSGLYYTTMSTGLSTQPASATPYSKTTTAGKIMPYLKTAEELYSVYTVVKTDWAIKIENPNSSVVDNQLFATIYEAFSNADATRVPTGIKPHDTWKT